MTREEQRLEDMEVEYHCMFESLQEQRQKYERALDVIQCLSEAAKAVPGTAPDQAELIEAYAEAADLILERANRRAIQKHKDALQGETT